MHWISGMFIKVTVYIYQADTLTLHRYTPGSSFKVQNKKLTFVAKNGFPKLDYELRYRSSMRFYLLVWNDYSVSSCSSCCWCILSQILLTLVLCTIANYTVHMCNHFRYTQLFLVLQMINYRQPYLTNCKWTPIWLSI